MFSHLVTLSRSKKNALLMLADFLFVPFALWMAFSLRLGIIYIPQGNNLLLFALAPLVALPIFYKLGLYRSVVRYIGYRGMLAIVQASVVLVAVWIIVAGYIIPDILRIQVFFPRSLPFLFWMSILLTVGGSRILARWMLSDPLRRGKKDINVVIYGAGNAGVELGSSLAHSRDMNVLGFVDDDAKLRGHYIKHLKVLGDRTVIADLRQSVGQLEVLLAIPSASSTTRKEILSYLEDKGVSVRTLPSFNEIAKGVAKLDQLQEVDVADLLGRDTVEPNTHLLSACIAGKSVLITGAGGSIGSELCRQVLQLSPSRLVLLEHSEYNLYEIDKELRSLCSKLDCKFEIVPILGSVINRKRVDEVVKRFKIETVYHAAAYKHVPIVEHNIAEGIRNNIFGTYVVASVALENGVENFVLISTDKAVRPTNVMGASKRMAELVVQGLHKEAEVMRRSGGQGTHFTMVRFGNVLGSSGSVIPLFKKQIGSGGPVTVTHPDITRFFMTIPEAAQLVIQAGSMGLGGDVFVLDMGEPVKIDYLARRMIHLSGHQVAENGRQGIAVEYTGLRHGEKLFEELLIGDNVTGTDHPKIMAAEEESYDWALIEATLSQLENMLDELNYEGVRALLQNFVSGYNSQCGIEDLIWKASVA